jgi:hypothetical protein
MRIQRDAPPEDIVLSATQRSRPLELRVGGVGLQLLSVLAFLAKKR